MHSKTPTQLLTAYFDRRADLARFFMARVRSEAETDDLMQDLYLRAAAAPEGVNLRNPGAYLFKLASNLMIDRLRQQRRAAVREDAWRNTHHVLSTNDDVADIPSAEAVVAGRQRLKLVLAALEALPSRTQQVFRMHKFDGESHAAIAERLGMSRSAVEKHMIEALRHLTSVVDQ